MTARKAKARPVSGKPADRPADTDTAGRHAVYDHTLQRFATVPLTHEDAVAELDRLSTDNHELSVERV